MLLVKLFQISFTVSGIRSANVRSVGRNRRARRNQLLSLGLIQPALAILEIWTNAKSETALKGRTQQLAVSYVINNMYIYGILIKIWRRTKQADDLPQKSINYRIALTLSETDSSEILNEPVCKLLSTRGQCRSNNVNFGRFNFSPLLCLPSPTKETNDKASNEELNKVNQR